MNKIILYCLIFVLIVNIQACNSSTSVSNNNSSKNIVQKEILKDYFAFIEKYEAANISNMRVEIAKPDQNMANYRIISNLLAEAESIENRMNITLAKNKDVKTQVNLKMYLDLIRARVITLKSNKTSFERIGGIVP